MARRASVREADWPACTEPGRMLAALRGKADDRKLRLFACACCRRVWKDLTFKAVRRAVETAERYADGAADVDELRQAHAEGVTATTRALNRIEKILLDPDYADRVLRMAFAVNAAHPPPFGAELLDHLDKDESLKEISPDLLRCVVGNPFRLLPAVDPACLAWNGGAVVRLAQAVHDDRGFDRLPVLADALEEAGCDSADILGHLRGPGPHVRGCWVIDLLLGKS